MLSKKDLPPIVYLKTDMENKKLSKAEFIEKRRRQKEEELAVSEFKKKRKEDKNAVQKEEGQEESVLEPKKMGRPKKVA